MSATIPPLQPATPANQILDKSQIAFPTQIGKLAVSGVSGMTIADVEHAVVQGGRFVIFQYCISILILTFRRSSAITFIPAGQSAVRAGLQFSLLSFVAGWWGIPWGPIYTIGALITNFGGGKDITTDLMSAVGGVRVAASARPAI